MRKSIRALGTALALLAAGVPTIVQAQEGCDDLRAQYQGVEALAKSPMSLAELRRTASDIASVAIDVRTFDALGYQRMSAQDRATFNSALKMIESLGASLGLGCDPRGTPTQCANSLIENSYQALRLADPARFEAWRIEDVLEKARAANSEVVVRQIAQYAGYVCPASGSCREPFVARLETLHSQAENIDMLDTITGEASGRDARAPLFELLKGQLLLQMGELHCGEGDEPPAAVAGNYSNPDAFPETEEERNAYFEGRDRAQAEDEARQEAERQEQLAEYQSRDRDRELSEFEARDKERADAIAAADAALTRPGYVGQPTPPQPQPIGGGPVVEMDPARPPEPTPTGGGWATVSPGQMTYRGTSETGTWSWSEPPQSIGAEGAVIALSVSGQVTNNNTWATGIQIRAPGFKLTSPGGIPIDGDVPLNLERNGSGESAIMVKVTPQDNYVGSDAVILIGAFYGAQVHYYYKVVRTAGS
jgi:hypothetical protein